MEMQSLIFIYVQFLLKIYRYIEYKIMIKYII